jgi:hypothetical protein
MRFRLLAVFGNISGRYFGCGFHGHGILVPVF